MTRKPVRTTLRSHNLPHRVGDKVRAVEIPRVLDTEGKHTARDSVVASAVYQESRANPPFIYREGFKVTQIADDDGGALTIATNPYRVDVVDTIKSCAYPATRVGSWGAGPPIMKAGWDHGVRLELVGSRHHLWHIDAHLVPSVTQSEAQARREGGAAAVEDLRERKRLHALEVANLVEMTQHMNNVVIMMDGNAPRSYPGWKPLIDAGFRDFQPGVTHPPHGRIDHAFVRVEKYAVVSARVMDRGPRVADHCPIELVLER